MAPDVDQFEPLPSTLARRRHPVEETNDGALFRALSLLGGCSALAGSPAIAP